MATNISKIEHPEVKISRLLALIGQPARIQILLVISTQEACVCHLEAALGTRQASISQHLMALRKGGVVTTVRDGRHVYYRLAQPEVLRVLEMASLITGMPVETLQALSIRPVPYCPCPQCNPGLDPKLVCKSVAQ